MPKLLILTTNPEEYKHLVAFANLPDLDIDADPKECDIVLGEPRLIRDALATLPALSWVQSIWAGVEPLIDPALRRNYTLTNARTVFGGLMSEYAIGYLLTHERKIFQYLEAQKNKIWDESNSGTLRGKTIGLLGVGSIGAEIARTAKFFGMKVRGYTLGSETSKHVDEYFHPLDSDMLLALPSRHKQASALQQFASGLDYLVSVLPNTKDTRKIVDANLLSALPPHALFLNVGRGAAVDQSALLDALNQNKIAGAVLDVFEQEPLPTDHPFWTTKNLYMTFHTSAPSKPEDIVRVFIENYMLYIEGKPLKYKVDFEREY